MIETGRYDQIPRDNRLCPSCKSNQIEDEIHLLFHCTKYCSFRDEFYKKIENQIPNITQLPPMQATKKLMNSDNYLNTQLMKFILRCLSLRNNLRQQEVPIKVVLPYKDQKAANSVRRQLSDLSRKINTEIRPVYTSRKIKDIIKVKEQKPPIVNQQSAVYYFKCDLCDADYVGYSCRHLHQRIEEHKGSAIGRHIKEQHGKEPDNIEKNFKILRKCQSKLDCLIFEMLFIRLLKPKLNKQSDSLRAKLFV